MDIQQLASDSDSNGNSNNNAVKKALVIAVSDYDDSSGLKSIEFCKNDGQEVYNVLKKNGYYIPDDHRLIGHVDSSKLKETIYDFFTDEFNKPDDTIVFYYSGHGVPDKFGKTYLAPSNMHSEHPFKTGFSFDDSTDVMLTCNSLRVVTILDSCFSGSLKIGKGLGQDSKSSEDATTRIANSIVEQKSDKLKQGIGRCLLASSQGYEEAYDRQEKDHSVFTYYLLEGLRGHKNAVDDEGNVTYDALGKFIAREMGSLPLEKRPKQTPVRKGEVSGGEIVLVNYPELRKKGPGKEGVLISEGIQCFENQDNDTAMNLFNQAIEINPKNSIAYNFKGDIFFRLRKYEEAIKCYDEALKINPQYDDVLKDKGLSLEKLGKYDEALVCFNLILNRNPTNIQYWNYKGSILLKTKRYEEAKECYDKIIDTERQNIEAWLKKGYIFEMQKQNDEALKCYREVVSLEPENIIAEDKIRILQSKHQSTVSNEEFNTLMKEGSELAWADRFEEALEKFEGAININPDNSYAYSKKSSVLIQMDKYKDALSSTDNALKIDTNNVEALFNKGYILAAAGRYEQAIEWYNKTTDLDFRNARAWHEKGDCYRRIGKKDKAKECFKIADDLSE